MNNYELILQENGLYENRVKTREYIFFILILLLYISYETWFLHGNNLSAIITIIRLGVPVVLLSLYSLYKPRGIAASIITIYFLFILNMWILSAIFTVNIESTIGMGSRYTILIVTFFILVSIFCSKNFSLIFLTTPIYIISIIILFAMIDFGHNRWGFPISLGGYLDYAPHDRLSAIFKEPSLLAACMEYSIFMTYGLFRLRKSKLFFIIFILLIISFYFTQSIAGFISIAGTILIFYLARWLIINKNPNSISFSIYLSIFTIIGSTILLSLIVYIINLVELQYFIEQGASSGSIIPSRSPVEQTARIGDFSFMYQQFMNHPFGVGIVFENDSPVFGQKGQGNITVIPIYYWLMTTGLTGLLLIFLGFFKIFKHICIPSFFGNRSLLRYAALSYICIHIHHLSYGRWLTFNVFYILAICLALYRFKEISDNKKISLIAN